jgi:hypothetical protein
MFLAQFDDCQLVCEKWTDFEVGFNARAEFSWQPDNLVREMPLVVLATVNKQVIVRMLTSLDGEWNV